MFNLECSPIGHPDDKWPKRLLVQRSSKLLGRHGANYNPRVFAGEPTRGGRGRGRWPIQPVFLDILSLCGVPCWHAARSARPIGSAPRNFKSISRARLCFPVRDSLHAERSGRLRPRLERGRSHHWGELLTTPAKSGPIWHVFAQGRAGRRDFGSTGGNGAALHFQRPFFRRFQDA